MAQQSESTTYIVVLHIWKWLRHLVVSAIGPNTPLVTHVTVSDIPMVTQSDPGTGNVSIVNAQTML